MILRCRKARSVISFLIALESLGCSISVISFLIATETLDCSIHEPEDERGKCIVLGKYGTDLVRLVAKSSVRGEGGQPLFKKFLKQQLSIKNS